MEISEERSILIHFYTASLFISFLLMYTENASKKEENAYLKKNDISSLLILFLRNIYLEAEVREET